LSDIDDTPGTRLPSEWLHESPQGRSASKRKYRLLMACLLQNSSHAGTQLTNGNQDDLRAWCWEQADKFLTDNDRPTSPLVTSAAVDPAPHVEHQRKYLEWLRDRDGSCLTSESPPGMHPSAAEFTRRHLLKRGLIAATFKGGAVEATGYAMTAAGWNSVEPVGATRFDPPANENQLPAERSA
jgi:hypothetical protein